MANTLRLEGIQCCKDGSLTILVDDEFSAVTTGSTIQVSDGENEKYCFW